MADVFKLQQVLADDESSFCEDSTTFAQNLPVLEGSAQATLEEEREDDGSIRSRLADRKPGHKGARRWSLTFRTYHMGFGGTAAGALSEKWQQWLLADGLGGGDVTQIGALATAGGNTTTVPLAGGGLPVRGAVIRVGTKGDGFCDGRAAAIASVASTTATLLNRLPGTPQVDDQVYASAMAYFVQGATLTSKRFCVMHSTTGAQFRLLGGQLSGVRFSWPFGSKGTIDWTYEGAYWDRAARSFPDAAALLSHDCGPITAGALFLNDVGTTTDSQEQAAELTLDLTLGLQPIVAPGGVFPKQYIVGWTRTDFRAQIEIKVPWKDAFETRFDQNNWDLTYQHMLWQANHSDGYCFGFYAPRIMPAGGRPSPVVEVNEQNYVTARFECREGTDTTNDLTRSAVRFFSC